MDDWSGFKPVGDAAAADDPWAGFKPVGEAPDPWAGFKPAGPPKVAPLPLERPAELGQVWDQPRPAPGTPLPPPRPDDVTVPLDAGIPASQMPPVQAPMEDAPR